MRVLVTGGAGFIGSHLVRRLVDQGHMVRILDNLSSGQRELLGPALTMVEFITGDIRDWATVQAATRHIDLVFHLAALVSVGESIEHPLQTHATNVTGTLHVLEAARASGVGRVVQASSCAVYGNTTTLPVGEAEPPQPLSPYALTKLAAEQAGQLYTQLYDVETVALRFFNVYGPRQDPDSPYAAVIPRFIAALLDGQQPRIYGDGHQSRDFVFVGDIVRALWTAATTPGIGGAVFNVGSGRHWSIIELAQAIGATLNTSVEPQFAPARSGEVRHSCASTQLFAERTGFHTQVDLHHGLTATVDAWNKIARRRDEATLLQPNFTADKFIRKE